MSKYQNENAPLFKLYNALQKAHFFQSKTVFYNCILSEWIYNPESYSLIKYNKSNNMGFIELIINGIKNHHQKNIHTSKDHDDTVEFYRMIKNFELLGNNDIETINESYPNITQSNNHKTQNINNYINGNKTINKTWRKLFLKKQNSQEKWEYIVNCAWVLQYYMLFTTDNKLLNESMIKKNQDITPNPIRIDYIEYYSPSDELLACINDCLTDFKKEEIINIRSFLDLSILIFDSINDQCDYSNPISEKEFNKCMAKISINKVRDLNAEREYYEKYVDIYSRNNLDRFNILEKNDHNLFCAYELGMIYIDGRTYKVRKQLQELAHDYQKSLYYFSKCVVNKSLYYRAAYQIAKMIIDGRISFNTDKERFDEAEKYIKMCGDFNPAKHLKAKIYKEKGDMIFFNKNNVIDKNFITDTSDGKHMISYYNCFLLYAFEAYDNGNGWIYAGNRISAFLLNEKYKSLLKYLKVIDILGIDTETILITLSENGNLWSKIRLAEIYLQDVKYSGDSKKRMDAKKLLEEACNENDPAAAYDLAENFYKNAKEDNEIIRYNTLMISSAAADYHKAKKALNRKN